jgi:glycosyltransferase involved in cell wall biosynthesis
MLSVLHLGKFPSTQPGGIETHIRALLTELTKNQVSCVHIAANHTFKTRLTQDTFLELACANSGMLLRTPICPTMVHHVRQLYRRHAFNIVHIHLPNPMAHLVSYVLPSKVKRIITWHSDIIKQKYWLHLYRPGLNHLVRKAKAVLVSNPYLARSNQIQIDRDRIHMIPFGINLEDFSANPAMIERIRAMFKDRLIIFALGRHASYKGFQTLLAALAQLPEKIVLLLGGEGEITDDLKKLAQQLNLSHRVCFLGPLDPRNREQLAAYYHVCDIFCMPSERESLGLVQLEAMACKKPVIACDLNNGVNYINQHEFTGLLVPPKDTRALVSSIDRLYRDPQYRNQLGENAYRRVLQSFTSQQMASKTLEIYQQIMNG